MNTNRAPRVLLPTAVALPLLLIGPIAMAMWVHSMGGSSLLPGDAVGPALIAVLAVWSPSPISIPALIMQDVRDASLSGMTGLVGSLLRGIIITPWLAFSKNSPVRMEMVASLVGFVAACCYVLAG